MFHATKAGGRRTPRASLRLLATMSDDSTVIPGHATLAWSDQIRFVARPYAKALLTYLVAAFLLYGAIWAITLPDDRWVALRSQPLQSLLDFLADVWPVYLGVGAALVL